MQNGKEEGIQEGIQKGIQKGKIEVILTGFDYGANIAFLSTITHLSEAEVTEILEKHGKI